MPTFEELQMAGLEPSLLKNCLGLSPKSLRLLFEKLIVTEAGCWLWMGAKRKGYGVVQLRSHFKSIALVHRVCYQLVNGAIPSSVQLHHEIEKGCMGPGCCHPGHLMETTAEAHMSQLHPGSIPYIASHRTSCERGHPYTIESLRITKQGFRECRICDAEDHQAARDAKHPDRPKFKKDPSLRKTHCLRGHALEGDNLYWYDTRWGKQARCRACQEQRNFESRERAAGRIPKHDIEIEAMP